MLKRVDADTFEANSGAATRIVAKASDGLESARFRYLNLLPKATINGHPGCQFDVVGGVEILSCVVVFSQDPAVRYDLFEVLPDGTENDLQISASPGTTGTTVQFRIDGLPVAVLAAARRSGAPRARATKAGKKKGAKKKAAKKTGRTKATRRTAKKAGARKSTRKGTRKAKRGGR